MRIASNIRAFTRNQRERFGGEKTVDRGSDRVHRGAFIFAWVDAHTVNDPDSHSLAFQQVSLSLSLFPRIWFRSVLLRHTNTRRRCEYLATCAAFTLPTYLGRTKSRRSPTLSGVANPGSSNFPSVSHRPLVFLLRFVGQCSLDKIRKNVRFESTQLTGIAQSIC